MNSECMARNPRAGAVLLAVVAIFAIAGIIVSCGGGSKSMSTGMGTVNVTMSDPPSCMPPNGQFTHVYVTVRSVQAHISATADDNSSGWQELAPQLASAPVQIDLFSKPQATCILARLGSASLPAGSYQQIRLLLVSNTAATSAGPSTNACAGSGFNCVVLQDSTIHELQLSSQDNTGLKIPPGQIVGGPLQVTAGQSVDLNIDFNACASIVQEGNGKFRLKPTLTAGQVSANNTGISGQVLDSITKAPIVGSVQVAIEQQDPTSGVDRILMQTVADSNGNFNFCPLPTGSFDIVVVGIGPANLPYNATTVLNVPNGTNLGAVPLIAEVGATAPAVFQGFVTATNGATAGTIDVSLSALETVASGAATTRPITIPLQTIPATTTSPEVDSTGLVPVSTNTSCPTGAPAKANCAQYTLVVPASNPSVGIFSSSGFTYSTPATGDVLFSVDARAAVPLSGGTLDCTPSEQTTAKDATTAPLKALPATTTNVAEIDFSSCM
ncbi:MAG TPA: DUF4382 domain-containing protein [Candidatus Acidoferrales bacterium]|jgi:hypothetical protein|nr:DUF4382 domain-containing protein [Candidatus Acidoferrales bacterium]